MDCLIYYSEYWHKVCFDSMPGGFPSIEMTIFVGFVVAKRVESNFLALIIGAVSNVGQVFNLSLVTYKLWILDDRLKIYPM
jgi:hypothetical protein